MMKHEDREILAHFMNKDVSFICDKNNRYITQYLDCCPTLSSEFITADERNIEFFYVVEVGQLKNGEKVFFRYIGTEWNGEWSYMANNSDEPIEFRDIKRVYPKEVTTIVYEVKK